MNEPVQYWLVTPDERIFIPEAFYGPKKLQCDHCAFADQPYSMCTEVQCDADLREDKCSVIWFEMEKRNA